MGTTRVVELSKLITISNLCCACGNGVIVLQIKIQYGRTPPSTGQSRAPVSAWFKDLFFFAATSSQAALPESVSQTGALVSAFLRASPVIRRSCAPSILSLSQVSGEPSACRISLRPVKSLKPRSFLMVSSAAGVGNSAITGTAGGSTLYVPGRLRFPGDCRVRHFMFVPGLIAVTISINEIAAAHIT